MRIFDELKQLNVFLFIRVLGYYLEVINLICLNTVIYAGDEQHWSGCELILDSAKASSHAIWELVDWSYIYIVYRYPIGE